MKWPTLWKPLNTPAGSAFRFIWNDQTTLARATQEHCAKGSSRPCMINQRLNDWRNPAALVLMLLTAGCAAVSSEPFQSDDSTRVWQQASAPLPRSELFEPSDPVVSFDELLRLTPEQRREFLAWYEAPEHSALKPHRRVSAYLESRLSNVLFDHQTRGAAEALAHGKGNCLSLALVTTAVSRLAGIENDWQLTSDNPIYSSNGSVIYSANHVHLRLYDPTYAPKPGHITLRRPLVLIDYFTDRPPFGGRTLNETQVTGLTYQNLAAEALAAGELSTSFQFAMQGVESDPANAELFNILGLLHQRKRAWATAEAHFRHALTVDPESLVTLRNLEALLVRQNRDEEAWQITLRIVALPDHDPFPLIEFGDQALAEGQIEAALRYYRRARELAPYLHQIHARIARAYRLTGRHALAYRSLKQALALSGTGDKRKRYGSKLEQLGRL